MTPETTKPVHWVGLPDSRLVWRHAEVPTRQDERAGGRPAIGAAPGAAVIGLTSWLDRRLSARALFVWSVVAAPSMLLPAAPLTRALLLLVLILLVLGTHRRMRWGRTATFFGAVVAFNLAAPGGRVLLEVGAFPITEGALRVGLTKAFSLTSLLLLSKVGIRRDLELPGRLGRLLTLTLAYVRFLLEADVKLLARDPVARLDRLLMQAHGAVGTRLPTPSATRSTATGIAILTALLALQWAAAIAGP